MIINISQKKFSEVTTTSITFNGCSFKDVYSNGGGGREGEVKMRKCLRIMGEMEGKAGL